MAYKKYAISLIIRLVLILINLTVLSTIILNQDRLFSILIVLIILISQITEMIKFELRTFNALEDVLNAIEFEHQAVRFNKKLPKAMEGFYQSLNKILDFIEKKKSENEIQLLFLAELLKHIKTGVLSISDNNNIELVNEAALDILGVQSLGKLEQLKKRHPLFYQEIMQPNQKGSQIIDLITNNKIQKLSIQISYFKSQGKDMKLVSFHDIRSQIEYKEMEAWHQLIRTLGHEILNSVTPISSMTETSMMLLEKEDQSPKLLKDLNDNNLNKIRNALKTINRRSIGLLDFINNYRKLTRMPIPVFEPVNLNVLLKNVIKLMNSDFEKNHIQLSQDLPLNKVIIEIDKSMIEQVLINLLGNAVQALEGIDHKIISVRLIENENNGPRIQIIDNGKGIDDEIKTKIFIPFFTTKEKGSGIGLSLSRQILQLHGGNIAVHTNGKGETIFSLNFK